MHACEENEAPIIILRTKRAFITFVRTIIIVGQVHARNKDLIMRVNEERERSEPHNISIEGAYNERIKRSEA